MVGIIWYAFRHVRGCANQLLGIRVRSAQLWSYWCRRSVGGSLRRSITEVKVWLCVMQWCFMGWSRVSFAYCWCESYCVENCTEIRMSDINVRDQWENTSFNSPSSLCVLWFVFQVLVCVYASVFLCVFFSPHAILRALIMKYAWLATHTHIHTETDNFKCKETSVTQSSAWQG